LLLFYVVFRTTPTIKRGSNYLKEKLEQEIITLSGGGSGEGGGRCIGNCS